MKFKKLLLIGLMPAVLLSLPAYADESQPEADATITKFLAAVGTPQDIQAVRVNGNVVGMVWQYKGITADKDMYAIVENGYAKAIVVNGNVAMVSSIQ